MNSETESTATRVEPIVTRLFAVFTDHNRYGPELRALFVRREDAKRLKQQFDNSQDGWKNHCGGEVCEVTVSTSFEEWIDIDDELTV